MQQNLKPFSTELHASWELRKALIDYIALNHANRISGLSKELGVSLSLVSRYVKGYRPMSAKFIGLIKQELKGFNYPSQGSVLCDNALIAMGQDKWLQEKPVLAVDVEEMVKATMPQ